MKPISLSMLFCLSACVLKAQVQTVSADRNWSAQEAVLQGTAEADWIIRVGDIDNLGFGWGEGFDPFCSRTSDPHSFPWDPSPGDLPGLDRILLSSKFKGDGAPCGNDGYSGTYDPVKARPVPVSVPTAGLKGATIRTAHLQLFIDDFQSPSFCSKFTVMLNGRRYAEAERIVNAIDQSGPVGKLITISVPEEFYPDLTNGKPLSLLIDETTAAGDGFAIDFIRLLINKKDIAACRGQVRGQVMDKETNAGIAGATVVSATGLRTTCDAEGNFMLNDLPSGFEVLTASASGYADGFGGADIGPGDQNPETVIYLSRGKAGVQFNNATIAVGQAVNLNNILFDQGKAELRAESKPELDKVVQLLQQQPSVEIELGGHTSSEGDAAMNRSLSYRRVKSCKDYLVSKGIDPGRVLAVGYGPDRPVASNDTEAGRALNRRVEMRLTKL